MVVYLDEVFLLNFVTDYLLLAATGRVAGGGFRKRRIALGALLGALYAAGCFFAPFAFLTAAPCKLAWALLMVLLAFGWEQPFFKHVLVFFGLSCALSGGVLALSLLGGKTLSMERGVLTTGMDLRAVLLSAVVCYLALSVGFRKLAWHAAPGREVVPVAISASGKEIRLTAFRDTGNDLQDPVTGRPAIVAELSAVRPLLPKELSWKEADLEHPAQRLQILTQLGHGGRFRLLPYHTIGGGGLLLAFQTDWVEVGGRRTNGMLVAITPYGISDGGAYSALVGAAQGKGSL